MCPLVWANQQAELAFSRLKAPLNKGMRNAVLLISSRALTPPPSAVAASTQAASTWVWVLPTSPLAHDLNK